MAAALGGEHAGWVYKQGSLVKNWKKRFMVLRGKQLTYYDTAHVTPKVKEKGSFQVIAAELDSEIQNGLIVHGRGGRVLKVYTANPESTSEWFNAIRDATQGPSAAAAEMLIADRFSGSSGGNGGPVDLDLAMELRDEEPVHHQGWLMKEGGRVRSWKRRYFTLRGNTLSYFETIGTGNNAKGYGHVQRVEVSGERPNTLDIRFDNGRILRVQADSAVSMQEWLCKLSDAIEAANIEHNNARESIALRQNMRASIASANETVMRPPMPQPMRHSIASPYRTDNQTAMSDPTPYRSTMSYDRNTSSFSTSSYQSSVSFGGDSLRDIPVPKDAPEDAGSDSDSDGDWI